MSNYPPKIAENLNKNYELFARNYKASFENLAEKNIIEIARKTDSVVLGSDKLILDFFERLAIVDLSDKRIYSIKYKEIKKEADKPSVRNQNHNLKRADIIEQLKNFNFKISDWDSKNILESLDSFSSAIILHFLLTADGTPLTGKWILYRELPDGLFYGDTIPGILQPLIKKYENSGQDFIKKISDLGGVIDKSFKFAAVLYPFRKFPALFVFEEKDEEFEADLRVLFDSSAPHYLKSDIIKTLVVYMVKKLL